MRSYRRTSSLTLLALAIVSISAVPCPALPDFAAETGLSCSDCHVEGADGGTLTETGERYLEGGVEALEDLEPHSAGAQWLRGLIRFLHLVGGVVWFGAIAYIHLFAGPRKFTKGLPKAEMRLGWSSIALMAVTGSLLSVWKLGSLEELWTTAFGRVWMVKVGTFLLMVVIAAVTTTLLNRRMRKAAAEEGGPGACGLVRFAYAGKLYDATESRWWKDGVHAGRHRAGTDLTEAMADAPHGVEVLDRIRLVGPVAEGCCAGRLPVAARAFIALAYVNLVLVAVILFCVSFWGWGLGLLD